MSGTILVTGAQGFVGRYYIAEARRRFPQSRIVGIGRSPRRAAFTHQITLGTRSIAAPILDDELAWSEREPDYRRIDITDANALVALFREIEPATVVHLASGLRDDPYRHLFRTNVEGTLTLLEAIAESGVAVKRIVLGSSGSVYGTTAVSFERLREDLACEPADIYAVSKLAAENAARIVARERGLPIVIARIFNVVGAGQEERHVVGRFASQLVAIAAGAPPRIAIGDLSPLRDFIDVRDVARGLADLAERGVPHQTYNVATGAGTPIATILETLLRLTGLAGKVDISSSYVRPADVPRFVADVERITSLGFTPAHSLEDSLAATLAYYERAFACADPTAAASASAAAGASTHG